MRTLIVAACLLAPVAAGCGGGDGSSSTTTTLTATAQGPTGATRPSGTGAATPSQAAGGLTDAQGVRAALEASLASSDPSQACGTYVTRRYLETAYGGKKGCLQAQQPGSAARSLGSLSAEIHGSRATASATPAGGPYDGSKVTAELLKEGGTWKVDVLHSNVPVGP